VFQPFSVPDAIRVLMLSAALLLAGSVVRAQIGAPDGDDFDRCRREASLPEARLKSCSNVIADTARMSDIRAEAYLNRGAAHEELGLTAKAIEDYSQGLMLNPNYRLLYHRRGLVYGDEGKHDLAIADFSQAIRLDPKDTEALAYRGLSYAGQDQHEKAILDYDAALAEAPDDPLILAMRGESREALGHRDAATADFRRALELDAQNELAKDGLERLAR